ncbi:MAG: GAF domain-containing sensor histidine kinase [Nitrospinota bacterium]|nr:GAF domain-containing sensor histidine kinase [Nitrospinota bacterium]
MVIWVLLAVIIFLADIFIPTGVADGMLYVVLVLVGLLAGNRRLILGGALLGTFLILAGFFLSPAGGEIWKVLFNRFLSIFTLWMTYFLCLLQNRSEKELAAAHLHLEERVRDRTLKLDEANRLLQLESAFVQLHKDIAVASNETRNVIETFQYCLQRICKHTGWPVGHLYLVDKNARSPLVSSTIWHLDDLDQFETFREISEATAFDPGIGLPGRVLESGKPAWINDVTLDPNFPRAKLSHNLGVKAGFAFPVLIREEVVGIMEFFSEQTAEPEDKLLEIMTHIGAQLGRVIERQRAEQEDLHSRQQLLNLYHRLEMVREEERTRIAREIHDELAQVLTALKLEISLLQKKLGNQVPALQKHAGTILGLVDQTIPAVKELIHDLRPSILDDFGLQETISWEGKEFERRTGIRCDLDLNLINPKIDSARSTAMFRIFQETLTNVVRHANARHVKVNLEDELNTLTLRVEDDGIGIDSKHLLNGKSLGILGMRERARVWGGEVDFQSEPQKGTTVVVQISRS